NVRAPDLVRDVHRAYVKAGAEVLETNSFGANRLKLAQFGLQTQVHELNRRAAELAREAAEGGRDVLVAGAVGPLGGRLEPYGATPEDVARALDRFGADVIGLNCSVGPQTILEAIEKMLPHTRRKLSAQPNAGMPRDVGGRSMYMASAEYMAEYARHLVHAGAKIVGGCCGTTPEHIHAMVEGIRPLAPRLASALSAERSALSDTHRAG